MQSIKWRQVLGACAFLAALSGGLEASARDTSRGKKVSIEQKKLAKQLPRTVVIRVKKGTHKVEVAQLRKELAPNSRSKAIAKKAHFSKLNRSGRVDRELAPASWSGYSWDFDCDEYYRYDGRSYSRSRYYDDYDSYDYNYDRSYWYYQPVYTYRSYNYPYSSYYGYSDGGYDYYYYGWANDAWWY